MTEDRDGSGGRTEPAGESASSALVQARLLDQVEVIRRYDPLVRRGAPESVHKMRVGVRRLSSALATFRPLFAREQTDPLRDELRWLASTLGECRDAEVLADRVGGTIADQPAGGPAAAGYEQLDRHLQASSAQARARVLEVLESDRYRALLDRLELLSHEPPWGPRAAQGVDAVLRARVRHDYRRVARRVELAHASPTREEREAHLHAARRAAKRVGYAAEPLIDVYGKPARRFVRAMQRVQSSLGQHHDAYTTQQRLHELGAQGALDGGGGYGWEALHAREDRALVHSEDLFERAWRAASRKKVRRWLTR